MKIVHIIPGFGGAFYCGNCLRDSSYTKTFKELGHDIIKLPIYLPLDIDSQGNLTGQPVFYGAVNLYLKQKYPFLRKMPKWMIRLLDSPAVLKFAAKKSGSTRAEGLEDMTLAMLLGDEGQQKEELNQLIAWMKTEEKPDIVHLSNALIIGMARKIKQELDTKIVISLQDEDVWLDAMRQPYRDEAWKIMQERAKDIDAFIPVSHFFKNLMKEKMQIPESKLKVIYVGIDEHEYKQNNLNSEERTIGYLSRLNEENGLAVLVDAFILLRKKEGFDDVKLKITGGQTGDDKKFINQQRKKLKKANLLDQVDFIFDYHGFRKLEFLSKITVLSVPVLNGEAYGLYQLEALASGVPLVQPNLGAFPEIVELSQAGLTYEPNTPDKLADALAKVLSDKEKLMLMRENGLKAVSEHFDNKAMAKKMIDVYKEINAQ